MAPKRDPFDPSDPNRKPTPEQVLKARERLGVTQREFGRIIKRGTQATISGWEGGTIVPSITLRLMEERIAAHVGQGAAPARPDGFALDPRSYALGTLANLGDDVLALRELADRMAAKVEAATATLGGATPPSVHPEALAAGRASLSGVVEAPAPDAQVPRTRRTRRAAGEG